MATTISSQKLSWNTTGATIALSEVASSPLNVEIDGAQDSQYLLIMRETSATAFTGSIMAGDYWMSGQGSKGFDISSSQSFSHAFGPFESGRFEQDDETFQVSVSTGLTDLKAGILEVPK